MHHLPEYTDEHLVTLLQTGDAAAFTAIFDRYQKRLFTEAYHKLEDVDEAQDVVQEIFIWLWQKKATLTIRTSLQAYLLQAVRYKCIDNIRMSAQSHKRQQQYKVIKETSTTIASSIENAELNQQLKQTINTLAPQTRHAFIKMYLEDKTHKEIAEEMGIKVQSVSNLVSQALKVLRKQLHKI